MCPMVSDDLKKVDTLELVGLKCFCSLLQAKLVVLVFLLPLQVQKQLESIINPPNTGLILDEV